MSLSLTTEDVGEIWMELEQHCPPATSIDCLETIRTVPSRLGSGYIREIELCPGLELRLVNRICHDLTQQVPENDHPIQFAAYLSGLFDSGDFARIDAAQSYVGSSGLQPPHAVYSPRSHRQIGVDIQITPDLLQAFFASPNSPLPPDLQLLIQDGEAQRRFSPKMTGAIRLVVQQIMDCPFLGAAKRLYWQGKVLELMALQLHGMFSQEPTPAPESSKPEQVARIHYAAEILRSHLEHPPCQTELARQVGVSDRTLQKGFKAVFGVTPFAYLTAQRMKQAEQLLRQSHHTVTEVATMVGYANSAKFAVAFKRQFGISPSECMRGKNY